MVDRSRRWREVADDLKPPDAKPDEAKPRRRKWKRWVFGGLLVLIVGGLLWLNGPGIRWLAPKVAENYLSEIRAEGIVRASKAA